MYKVTHWRPDTCACQLAYGWDTDAAHEDRVHTAVSATPCSHHRVGDPREVFATVLEENQRKNHAIAALIALAPDLEWADVVFSFDESRRLVLSGPMGDRRTTLHTALQRLFGDRVRVE